MDAAEESRPLKPLDETDERRGLAKTQDGCLSQVPEVMDGVMSRQLIQFMWDYTVQVPLWSRTGHMSEDPVWLSQNLGASEELINAMMAWCDDMDRLNCEPLLWTREASAEMDQRGRALADRLQTEVGENYFVQFKS